MVSVYEKAVASDVTDLVSSTLVSQSSMTSLVRICARCICAANWAVALAVFLRGHSFKRCPCFWQQKQCPSLTHLSFSSIVSWLTQMVSMSIVLGSRLLPLDWFPWVNCPHYCCAFGLENLNPGLWSHFWNIPALFFSAYQLASLCTASFQVVNIVGIGSFIEMAFCIGSCNPHQKVLMVPWSRSSHVKGQGP